MPSQQSYGSDPKGSGPKPPFPEQQQPKPGIESKMEPTPDFGEDSYQGSGQLTGKAALITGADSGIGRAVAVAFAREGADVLISYLSEDSDAEETARVVEAAGRKAVTVPGDIGDERHCQQLVDRVMQEFGRIDILVNNAAYQATFEGGIVDTPSDAWEHTFRTNIHAMFYLSKAALPHLPNGGTIINTTSIEAYQPKPSLLAYASTKGAIVTFTKALSEEAIEKGVRVNAVAPGPVWTPLNVAGSPPEHVKQFGSSTPIGRPAQPAELAPAYVFLASSASSYVVGQVLGVTGGRFTP